MSSYSPVVRISSFPYDHGLHENVGTMMSGWLFSTGTLGSRSTAHRASAGDKVEINTKYGIVSNLLKAFFVWGLERGDGVERVNAAKTSTHTHRGPPWLCVNI